MTIFAHQVTLMFQVDKNLGNTIQTSVPMHCDNVSTLWDQQQRIQEGKAEWLTIRGSIMKRIRNKSPLSFPLLPSASPPPPLPPSFPPPSSPLQFWAVNPGLWPLHS